MPELNPYAPMIRAMAYRAIQFPHEHDWTLQGFGMLRTYFGRDDAVRLNIWDSEFTVDNVSSIHNHPWNFSSFIVCGELTNVRYFYSSEQEGGEFWQVLIQPGEHGGPVEEPQIVHLHANEPEVYRAAQMYYQDRRELHETRFADGTVTVNCRQRPPGEDRAVSIWRGDSGWVSAEPRPATVKEVARITERALEVMEAEGC